MFFNGKHISTSNNKVPVTQPGMTLSFEDIYIMLNSTIDSGKLPSLYLTVFINMLNMITINAYIEYCIQYIVIGVYISGYHVVPKALSGNEILQITKSCHTNNVASIISMDDLKGKSGVGLQLIVPSQCSSEYFSFVYQR